MIADLPSTDILVYSQPVDMRRAIDGLASFVSSHLDLKPDSGTLYLFYNRRRDKIKILYWQRNGFCLWYKRLEKDLFVFPSTTDKALKITLQQLRWLLDGLDLMTIQGHGEESFDLYGISKPTFYKYLREA